MSSVWFEVHAGDFEKGKHRYVSGKPGKLVMKNIAKFFRETIPVTEIAELEVASAGNVKRIAGAANWNAGGDPPVPSRLLGGGIGKEVTFLCRLKDGRKFIATAPSTMITLRRSCAPLGET